MQTTSALTLLDKINHLAGQGRNRDGLHKAAPGLQYLREHHGGDFIRLAASGQAEDAKRRRVGSINETRNLRLPLCASAVVSFACISCCRSPRS